MHLRRLVMLLVLVLLAGCADSDEPSPTAPSGAAPSASASATSTEAPVSIKRGPVCPSVDKAVVPQLIGAVKETYDLQPGDTQGPNGPVTKSFLCEFQGAAEKNASTGESSARRLSIAVFGTPSTEADYTRRLETECASKQDRPVDGFGDKASARICAFGGGKSFEMVALIGDALFDCSLSLPGADLTAARIEQTQQLCQGVVRGLAA